MLKGLARMNGYSHTEAGPEEDARDHLVGAIDGAREGK